MLYPSGCIIAKAKITDCIEITDDIREELKQLNPLVYSRVINDTSWKDYEFQLPNIEKIEPISINSQLGLWNYEYKE